MVNTISKRECVTVSEETKNLVRALRNNYYHLMSLNENQKRNVFRLFRNYLLSGFGLEYLRALDVIARKRLLNANEKNRNEFCRWIDNEIMENFVHEIVEEEVFDDIKALSEITNIIVDSCSYFRDINEEEIETEMDYILDLPSQIKEMIKESPNIQNIIKYSFKREEPWGAEKGSIRVSPQNVTLSYRVDIKR